MLCKGKTGGEKCLYFFVLLLCLFLVLLSCRGGVLGLAVFLKAFQPGHAFFAGDAPPRNYYRLGYSSIPHGRIMTGLDIVQGVLNT